MPGQACCAAQGRACCCCAAATAADQKLPCRYQHCQRSRNLCQEPLCLSQGALGPRLHWLEQVPDTRGSSQAERRSQDLRRHQRSARLRLPTVAEPRPSALAVAKLLQPGQCQCQVCYFADNPKSGERLPARHCEPTTPPAARRPQRDRSPALDSFQCRDDVRHGSTQHLVRDLNRGRGA